MLHVVKSVVTVFIGLAAGLVVTHGQVLPRPPAPDLVLFNGKIITVDRDFSTKTNYRVYQDR